MKNNYSGIRWLGVAIIWCVLVPMAWPGKSQTPVPPTEEKKVRVWNSIWVAATVIQYYQMTGTWKVRVFLDDGPLEAEKTFILTP